MVNLQTDVQSGTECTQEPAVPTKPQQDVTEPRFILVPSIVSAQRPACMVLGAWWADRANGVADLQDGTHF